MNQKYYIYQTIQLMYAVRVLGAGVGAGILFFAIGPENWSLLFGVKKLSSPYFFLIFGTFTFILYKLLRRIPKRKVNIEINHKFLEFNIQNIFYLKSKKQIFWDDIISYSEDLGQGFYIFKLKSKNEKLRLVIDVSDIEPYQEFYTYFEKKIKQLSVSIGRERKLHEKRGGFYYALLLSLLLVLYTAIAVNNNRFNWAVFATLFSGTLFFSYKVYKYHKDKNELDV